MKTADVLAGWCHTGIVYAPFMESVMGAFSYDRGKHLNSYTSSRSAYIPEARCNVVREFLKGESEWLWFLDSDVVFAPDTLEKLLAAADPEERPVMAAPYWNEYAGVCAVTWLIADDAGFHPVVGLPETDEPIELSSVGMGCTLIHRNVLQSLADRHVNDPWPWYGNDVFSSERDGEQVLERVGEDMTFCARAKLAGFTIWGLPSLTVEHYKPHLMRHGDPEPEPACEAA